MRAKAAITAALVAGAILPAMARAEVIELLDKTKIAGKIVHYYDGVYSVEAQGSTIKLPKEKIRSISFQLPPPRPEFSTAEKAFERWRKALAEGDVEKIIDCYALMYQGMLATQVGQAADGVKKMQKEMEGTKFSIKGSSTKGDTTTLQVNRQKGDSSDTGDVVFVRENGEWKMLPPQ
jgi:ketosteroid isomerase-like protein